jgi:hypothetical protein
VESLIHLRQRRALERYDHISLDHRDDGLNGGTPFELALDLRREAALLWRCSL